MKQRKLVTELEAKVLGTIIGGSTKGIIGKMLTTRKVIAENPYKMAGAISTLQRKGYIKLGQTRKGNKAVSITMQGWTAVSPG